ncbi:hypothetical protein SASPL_135696 [Salvia splendens]|uniref:Uncharacterized protein n=1 Tax=Salvia splendens TaxID=180675 RepID=A0A8X8WZD3_SALSN|nr:hypothetical protein SASPL_135696 [Salvia splendens]
MMSFEMNDRKKIGLGLTGFGVFFSFLGIIFFFDKGLLAMGNVNPFLLRRDINHRAQVFCPVLHEAFEFQGIFSCYDLFPFPPSGSGGHGMIVEAYGFIVLFSGFWPTLAVFLQKMPIIGWLFQQPIVRSRPLHDDSSLYYALVPVLQQFY